MSMNEEMEVEAEAGEEVAESKGRKAKPVEPVIVTYGGVEYNLTEMLAEQDIPGLVERYNLLAELHGFRPAGDKTFRTTVAGIKRIGERMAEFADTPEAMGLIGAEESKAKREADKAAAKAEKAAERKAKRDAEREARGEAPKARRGSRINWHVENANKVITMSRTYSPREGHKNYNLWVRIQPLIDKNATIEDIFSNLDASEHASASLFLSWLERNNVLAVG